MQDCTGLFKVLSDNNRIRIINLLERRPLCVCEIAHILGVTQPSISRHLRKMKSAGREIRNLPPAEEKSGHEAGHQNRFHKIRQKKD